MLDFKLCVSKYFIRLLPQTILIGLEPGILHIFGGELSQPVLCQQPSSACQLPSASLLTCSSSSSILCSHTSGPFHFPSFLLFQFQSLRLVCSSPLWGNGCGDSGPQLWQILSQQQLCSLGAPGPNFRIFPEPTFFFLLNSASPYLAPSHWQNEDHMCIVSLTGKSWWGSAGPFSGWSFFPHLCEISPFCIVFTLS